MNRYYLERAPHSIVFASSVEDLYNNHKINFDGEHVGVGNTRHTSLDWFLVPTERPSIDKATVKEHYIDIPGVNGGLDLTESLTGFPLYNYIEGSFEFNILNERKLPTLDNYNNLIKEKTLSWEFLNRDIRAFLNGKRRYMMLEDDPSWYYEGRFTVEKYNSSEESNSKIVISYKVYPYKKLATAIYTNSPLNILFDTVSLHLDDIRESLMSFWNKTEIRLYPEDSKQYKGNIKSDLPCGNEAVPVIFDLGESSKAFPITATFKNETGTIVRPVKSVIDEELIKIRGIVLTNKDDKGILYSDNELKVEVGYPALFDENTDYSKGDYISYIGEQTTFKWILQAKEDISKGSFNVANWDVVLDAMNITEFSAEKTYHVGNLVYISGTLLIYEATAEIEPHAFDATEWTVYLTDTTKEKIYKPVNLSIQYDIGVM